MYCCHKASTEKCTERMEGEHCQFEKLFVASRMRIWALLDPFA
jgi:hypothetical protein